MNKTYNHKFTAALVFMGVTGMTFASPESGAGYVLDNTIGLMKKDFTRCMSVIYDEAEKYYDLDNILLKAELSLMLRFSCYGATGPR